MKKRILAVVLLLLLLLSGCGGESAQPFSPALADQLLASGAFEGSEMAPLDVELIPILYGINGATITQSAYHMAVNTAASADELLILVLSDGAAAVAAESACRARIESQLAVCRDYCPAAIPRLEKALVIRRENTLLLAVGDPEILAAFDGGSLK